MANWAVVIGIDKYWRPEFCLRGAVRDALAMRRWLLDPAGGNIPLRNLNLVLEPDQYAPESGIGFLDGRHNTIVQAIDDILLRSGGSGERVFFYFAGHGLMGTSKVSLHSAMLAFDFTDLLSTNSLTVASIFELFQGTQFAQQYFFIDACRNMPFDTEKRLGEYPNPRNLVPPVSPQFIMYATQPGVKALEIRDPGNEKGAFTAALLTGLRGEGSAKRWDEEAGHYVVRWSSLFNYVHARVLALKLGPGNQPDSPLIQEPRHYGERNSLDPELGRFGGDGIGQERLQIDLDPAQISNGTRVTVTELAGISFQHGPPVANLPLTALLVPRTYGVSATAPGYRMQRRVVEVDLYEPKRVTVELVPDVGPPGPLIRPVQPRAAPATGTIAVSCSDMLAQLELARASGQVVQSGRGIIFAWNLPAGFYRARLISPEGSTTEKLVELLPGTGETSVTLGPPLPQSNGMKWAITAGQFEVRDDGTVEPSESIRKTAFLKLSTVLALAAAASTEGENAAYGHKLRRLGIPGFYHEVPREETSGIMLLLGDENLDARSWRRARFQCASQEPGTSLLRGAVLSLDVAPGLAYAAIPAQPGCYWLSLQMGETDALRLSVAVLPERATMAVITREPDGSVELHQYQPRLNPPPPYHDVSYEERIKRDPDFGDSHFAALRRIELMQRSVAHGRVYPTVPDVDMLLYDKWRDPIAGCLGGYLLVRMGRMNELGVPAHNLVTYFGHLPDAHVLMAVYRESQGDKSGAMNAYVEALSRGMPIYRDGLSLLRTGLARAGQSDGSVREVLALVPVGSLWSAMPSSA